MCGVPKEWDEALCPICMEHPHNAVLLLCNSHSIGCRPYICDTSYRHSNCLDRFRKLQIEARSPDITRSENPHGSSDVSNSESNLLFVNDLPEHARVHTRGDVLGNGILETLKCPLCRGDVLGQTVVEDARDYLNLKPRSCTCESCTFVGNYRELRRHARGVHPRVRPAEINPSRQQAWRRLEHEREHDDVVSAIRSAIPGAVMVGDYALEGGERFSTERERASRDANGGPSWTTLLFVQMLESMQPRVMVRLSSRLRHPRLGMGSSRLFHLGDSFLRIEAELGIDNDTASISDDDEVDVVADGSEEDSLFVRRQRRRLTQSRSNRDRL